MANKLHRNALKAGHKIHWYEIKQILGQGGFGITYLAYDPNLEKHVAIKEYLPVEVAVREHDASVHPVSDDHGEHYRWGLERFIVEARTLSKFKHPNIVHVLSVTEDNNTAYMVMEYEAGQSLQEILTARKTLAASEVMNILLPIVDGLEIVHAAGFIHRDIKPANIYIREDGSPVLLDFGSARQALGEETKTLTTMISPGYAPFEQYFSSSSEQGEWTDIYALGATLYRAVTGIAPHDAVDRSNAILKTESDTNVPASELAKGKYPATLLKAIDHAIAFRIEDRPQTLQAWRQELTGEQVATEKVTLRIDQHATTVAATEAQQRSGQHQAQPDTGRKRHSKLWLLAPLLAIGLAVMMLFVFDKKQSQRAAELTETEQATASHDSGSQAATAAAPPVAAKQTSAESDRPASPPAQLPAAKTVATPTQEQTREPDARRATETDRLLKAAQRDIDAGRLITPEDNNAYARYKEVLGRDPGNAEAREGMATVAKSLLAEARQAANARNYREAEEKLKTLKKLFPDSAPLNDLIKRMRKAIKDSDKYKR